MDTSQTYLDLIKHAGLGIVVKENVAEAKILASSIINKLCPNHGSAWVYSTSQLDKMDLLQEVPLIITIGGDGTILRTARLASSQGIPILGINMGGVGYLTELESPDLPCFYQGTGAIEKSLSDLQECLSAFPRIEERSMLEIRICTKDDNDGHSTLFALNEVVVARNGIARLTVLDLMIDDYVCGRIRSDGAVIATPTGSTDYVRSLGGPIVYPESSDLLLLLPASQSTKMNPIVLGPNSTVRLKPVSTDSMVVSVDGFMDHSLDKDELVEINAADRTTKFLRYKDAHNSFYSRLWKTE